MEGGDYAAALERAQQLANLSPDQARNHVILGRVWLASGSPEQAAASFERAAEMDPLCADAHLELGRLHVRERRFEEAQDELLMALHHDPHSAQAHYELGRLQWVLGKAEEAATSLRTAVELDADFAAAYSELGFIYSRLKQFGAAIEVLERAATLDPRDVNIFNRLGYALVQTEQYERGRSFFARVCEVTPPHYLGPRLNLANALFHLGDFAAAREIYDRILARAPNEFQTRWNRAHLILAERRFDPGWQEYESRWMVPSAWTARLIPYEPWTRQPLEGKTVLVSAEQGLGDEIMFASCVPDVAGLAKRVVLECDRRLEPIFRRSFPQVSVLGSDRERQVPMPQPAPVIDYHVLAGSLPLHFRRSEADFPRHAGYLKADPGRIAHWRKRLDALGPGLKVGLSWRGGTLGTRTSLRSLPLDQLLPLLRVKGARFVSLQYGDCTREIESLGTSTELAHWQEAIDDYDETAAFCCALDMTISVCTAIIHLNGALGRPVWVMVPAVPEWRYGFSGADMPWYPTARLFRQARSETWDAVVRSVASELGALTQQGDASGRSRT